MRQITINDVERKRAFEPCEAIIIGFQNEARDPKVYEVLQEVQERIYEEIKPIEDKEKMFRNEERGVKTLAQYLGIPVYKANFMLDPCLRDEAVIKEQIGTTFTAIYNGRYHEIVTVVKNGDKENAINLKVEGAEE